MDDEPINEILSELHLETAELLLKRIRSGEATAAEINNALKMLKDNDITAVPTVGSPLGDMAKELPQFTEQDEALN